MAWRYKVHGDKHPQEDRYWCHFCTGYRLEAHFEVCPKGWSDPKMVSVNEYDGALADWLAKRGTRLFPEEFVERPDDTPNIFAEPTEY